MKLRICDYTLVLRFPDLLEKYTNIDLTIFALFLRLIKTILWDFALILHIIIELFTRAVYTFVHK